MNEFEMFWGNIWKKPDSIDMEKWSEFRNIMSFHVKVENEGILLLIIIIIIIIIFSFPGKDKICNYWMKGLGSMHELL